MTTKHTPGPWDVYRDERGVTVHATPIRVARVLTDYAHRPGARDANARLIAAAPDLLAACEEALEAFASLGIDATLPVLHMRAAVAKARGES